MSFGWSPTGTLRGSRTKRLPSDAGQVDQGQVDDVGTVDLEDDGALRHADPGARLADCVRLDLVSHLVEVVVLSTWLV